MTIYIKGEILKLPYEPITIDLIHNNNTIALILYSPNDYYNVNSYHLQNNILRLYI